MQVLMRIPRGSINPIRSKRPIKIVFILLSVLILSDLSYGSDINIWLDTHCHTKYDDLDNFWTPEESIAWHVRNGYNAMAITNHMPDEYLNPSLFERPHENFVLIPGREFTIENYHLIVLFNPATYRSIWPNLSTLVGPNPYSFCYDKQAIVNLVDGWHKLGALAGVAHPHLRENPCPYNPSPTEWKNDLKFDFAERITTGLIDFKNIDEENRVGLKVTAGTDGHNLIKTAPGGYTRMVVEEFTAQAIFDTLVKGDYIVEFDPDRVSNTYKYVLIVVTVISFLLLCVVCCMGGCIYKYIKQLRGVFNP